MIKKCIFLKRFEEIITFVNLYINNTQISAFCVGERGQGGGGVLNFSTWYIAVQPTHWGDLQRISRVRIAPFAGCAIFRRNSHVRFAFFAGWAIFQRFSQMRFASFANCETRNAKGAISHAKHAKSRLSRVSQFRKGEGGSIQTTYMWIQPPRPYQIDCGSLPPKY